MIPYYGGCMRGVGWEISQEKWEVIPVYKNKDRNTSDVFFVTNNFECV